MAYDLGAVHSHEPNFHIVCGHHGCSRTYHNFHSFRKHLRRVHLDVVLDQMPSADMQPDDIMQNTCDTTYPHQTDTQCGFETRNSALFLLKAHEVYKVSQLAINEMTAEFHTMSSSELDLLKMKVFSTLRAAGIDPGGVVGLSDVFGKSRLADPFGGLLTEYQQEQFFKKNLNLVVSPWCTALYVVIKPSVSFMY